MTLSDGYLDFAPGKLANVVTNLEMFATAAVAPGSAGRSRRTYAIAPSVADHIEPCFTKSATSTCGFRAWCLPTTRCVTSIEDPAMILIFAVEARRR